MIIGFFIQPVCLFVYLTMLLAAFDVVLYDRSTPTTRCVAVQCADPGRRLWH